MNGAATHHLRSLHNTKSKQSPTISNGDIELNKYRDFADMKKRTSDSAESIRFSINGLFENAYFMNWTAGDLLGVVSHHPIPCVFAASLLFFMAVEYTLYMVPPTSPPFDLGFIATVSLHRLLESWPALNTLLAGLNTVFVGMQTAYILWTWLVEGRPRATISALFMFTCRGILGYATQLPLPERDPIYWVSTHRYHHQFCDTEKDPHSPIGGFWFSHITWIFDNNSIVEKCGKPNNVGDLEKQPFYKFLESTYIIHPIALGALLYALGGFPYIVWGMGVRTVFVYHGTWLVNSASHTWGKQAWNTGDLSKNNWWLAMITFGEGWHNNHHAFEYSARQGLEWWQIDITWYVIRLLEAIGLATDVKLPTSTQKRRMVFNREVSIAAASTHHTN